MCSLVQGHTLQLSSGTMDSLGVMESPPGLSASAHKHRPPPVTRSGLSCAGAFLRAMRTARGGQRARLFESGRAH
jgi:hypothetical protein